MRAFEVHINKKRICVAGVGDDGVLSLITTHAVGDGYSESWLTIGGIIATEAHVKWAQRKLKMGDDVRVKLVETEKIDRPKKRDPIDHKTDLAKEKAYVRKMARKYGWEIVSKPTKRSKA